MKKFARRALIAVTAVVAVVVLGLTATTIVNVVATEAEKDRILPYGQTVEVGGRNLNVLVTGNGPDTIVLLPGFGTASPGIDFAPLLPGLSATHRVVVVEPFGYGLSDSTDVPRTTENIVHEIHEAVASLGIDRYTLMGHSIAGLYAIEYTRAYRDEVTAFVGIDTSVPGQPETDTPYPTGLFAAMKSLGIIRLLSSAGGDYPDVYTAEQREQMDLISNRTSFAPTYLDEMSRFERNFRRAEGTGFPADLPVLLFVEQENESNPDWLSLHEKQAAAVTDGTVVTLPGEHYLHHTEAAAIVSRYADWMSTRSAAP